MRDGVPPSRREIAEHFGIALRAAADRVSALVKKGYLVKQPATARGLIITHRANEVLMAYGISNTHGSELIAYYLSWEHPHPERYIHPSLPDWGGSSVIAVRHDNTHFDGDGIRPGDTLWARRCSSEFTVGRHYACRQGGNVKLWRLEPGFEFCIPNWEQTKIPAENVLFELIHLTRNY